MDLNILGKISEEKSWVLCIQLQWFNRKHYKSETYKWDRKKGVTSKLQENVMLSTIIADNKLCENRNKKA